MAKVTGFGLYPVKRLATLRIPMTLTVELVPIPPNLARLPTKTLIVLNRVALVASEHLTDLKVSNQVILNPQDDQGVIPLQSRISQGSQVIHREVLHMIDCFENTYRSEHL